MACTGDAIYHTTITANNRRHRTRSRASRSPSRQRQRPPSTGLCPQSRTQPHHPSRLNPERVAAPHAKRQRHHAVIVIPARRGITHLPGRPDLILIPLHLRRQHLPRPAPQPSNHVNHVILSKRLDVLRMPRRGAPPPLCSCVFTRKSLGSPSSVLRPLSSSSSKRSSLSRVHPPTSNAPPKPNRFPQLPFSTQKPRTAVVRHTDRVKKGSAAKIGPRLAPFKTSITC